MVVYADKETDCSGQFDYDKSQCADLNQKQEGGMEKSHLFSRRLYLKSIYILY